MNIIYFDYIENYGINAGVGADSHTWKALCI
ncbi:hypothetical protein AHYW_002197 [Providencia manganoxydans]